ncbi:hypothetical protein MKD41_01575 [Lutibacter sp. A64]|uniref:hypothetical protein n=1 Tax=Lutibacter sp. A64 TaxID=2918526 RepID=UPI001F054CAD|nr:hypothetical protein [Lutibacter sp. A64]UMB54180.1 hypothetical protein MKD41_01575 [Lutibacter sp. A64]
MITKEGQNFDTTSTLWDGYNAFNAMLHNNFKKTFSKQEKLDKLLFDEIYAMV